MSHISSKIYRRTALAIAMTLIAFTNHSYAKSDNMIKYQAPELEQKSEKRKKFTHFTSGTGFYVSNSFIVTNEHVVQGCKSIKIRGAVDPAYATISAIDSVNDLALLKTSRNPIRVAPLRAKERPLQNGEPVTVMGYPMDYGVKGKYHIENATVTDTNDVYDGISRIQFTDSVEKGNSGGPLLDENGNVVGVIVGKMTFYLADASTEEGIAPEPVKTSSMAINLDSLKGFLKANNVYYKEDHTNYSFPDQWVEQKASQYIVNIHCVKD